MLPRAQVYLQPNAMWHMQNPGGLCTAAMWHMHNPGGLCTDAMWHMQNPGGLCTDGVAPGLQLLHLFLANCIKMTPSQ